MRRSVFQAGLTAIAALCASGVAAPPDLTHRLHRSIDFLRRASG